MKRTAWTTAFGAAIAAATFACSDGGGDDAGTSVDSGESPDIAILPDAGVDGGRVDTGIPRPDGGADAGVHYCSTTGRIMVGGAEVNVGESSAPALHEDNARADLQCIDEEVEPDNFTVPIFLRGCFDTAGTGLTRAELDDIEVAVFPARYQMEAVDPSFDFTTGFDREPARRLEIDYRFDDNIPQTSCRSRVQLEVGFDARGDSLQSEVEYIVRVRTSSDAAQLVVAPTYYFGIIVRNVNVAGAPIELSFCSTQQCYLRHNFNVVRASDLTTALMNAQNPVPGSMNLSDGLGAGYAMIETYDCADLPMVHAVAGFNPQPLNDAFRDENGFNFNLTESTAAGLYLALGFPGQAATASTAIQAVGAIGAKRDDVCTEEFGGRTVTVYPDSLSVIRAGTETVLHGN